MITTVERALVERFRDLVAIRLGLQFENGKLDHLADVLAERLRRGSFPSPQAYLEHLESPAAAHAEMAVLAAELTVGETYFLRHPDQFRAFADVVLPERLSAQAAQRRLRLLSAGCASGEEAYSLAMLLCEGVPERGTWDLRVYGWDVNPAALQKAAAARYSAWSLRGVPADIVARCFRQAGSDYVLDDSARGLVSFEVRNLAQDDPGFWRADEFDAIFCRNVTMYLTPDATRRLIARLTRSLVPGGYLFLGPAENLRGLSHDYHLRHTHETFYYQRRLPEEQPAARAPFETAPDRPAETWLSQFVADQASWVGAISQSSDRIEQLSEHLSEAGAARGGRESSSAPRPTTSDDTGSRGLRVARELLSADRFEDALAVLEALPPEEGQNPDVQLLAAMVLTNLGRVAEAEHWCRRVLAGDELNAEAHYLLALCCEHAGEYQRALEHDQRAIYLDPHFAMPHLHLGLLGRKTGDRELCFRAFRQAAALLARADASRILLFGGGFNREALIRLCQAELRACGGSA